EILFAGAEERFSRIKKDRSFPRRSIQAALDFAGIAAVDLDAVAFGWNAPVTTPWHTLKSALKGQMPRSYLAPTVIDILYDIRHKGGKDALQYSFGDLAKTKIFFIDHHLAHAYSAYNLSGFDEAIVLVVDGRGAYQATSIYHGQGDRLRRVRWLPYPNSLGMLYESFTDLLGFERHSDEWKVMGLAAYGEPTVPMDPHITITDDGYRVHARTLIGRSWTDLSPLTARYGPRRNPEKQITDEDRNLAASVQKATEDAMFSLLRDALGRIPSKNLCLAGGVAMNSKANGKLLASGLIERIFIQPAATDDGTALGAALAGYHRITGEMPRYEMRSAYLGPGYSQEEMEQALRVYKIPFHRSERIARVTAQLLAQGNIVGWFQGRMEFGPRALGNRSILADARDPEMKDKVNDSIKFRENWRPFAPSVLLEKRADYFQPDAPSPFMILTHTVREDKRLIIPAVTHADNSARIQTVDPSVNPRYWEIIHEFEKITGVAVIMNTSFNLRGEPIVCEPKDAIRTFFSSGLDFLVLGDCLIAKDPSRLANVEDSQQRQ
ncbi:MAG TPA: carbamoyltransferase C-terminal domain-containing protein, partial [Longimicrobium sp.]|nr:carbamoyltransferase C-terminal domain-containing protein [Longimicrobium sp.]